MNDLKCFQGNLGIAASEMADAMFEGLTKFAEAGKPAYLQEVIFTIYQLDMLPVFISTLKGKVREKQTPSLWQHLWGEDTF